MGARNETEGQTQPWEIRTESGGNLRWSLFCRNPLSSAQQITGTHRSSYVNTGKNQLRKRAAAFQKLDKILGSQDLFSACLKAHRAGQKPSLCLISPSWASVKKCKKCYALLPSNMQQNCQRALVSSLQCCWWRDLALKCTHLNAI